MLRARSARSDDAALLASGTKDDLTAWESTSAPDDLETVFEDRGTIVGIDAGVRRETLTLPPPSGDPPPTLASVLRAGTTDVDVGEGLWIANDLPEALAVRIHRHARTLRALERGVAAAMIVVPLPTHDLLGPVGTAQMCIHGAIDWPPIRLPLEDGWWPAGLTPDRQSLVLVWRNRG